MTRTMIQMMTTPTDKEDDGDDEAEQDEINQNEVDTKFEGVNDENTDGSQPM